VRGAFLFLALSPILAAGQGPIETRNARAPSLTFLRLNPRGPLLAPGERSFRFGLMSANNLRLRDGVREDQETERAEVRLGWGVARGEWTLHVPFLSRGGGFMDPLILGYHRLIGIHNQRETIPFGRSEEILPGIGSFGSATGLGDISATYSHAVSPNTFASFAVKLPTGNAGSLLGSGNVDVGMALYKRWRLGARFNLYGQIGGIYQGKPTRLRFARSLVDQESLALEFLQSSRDAFTFQWQSEPSALILGSRTFDGPHRQLSVGYTRQINPRDTVQFFMTEDGDFLNYRVPILVNVAPDISLGVNFTRRF